MSTVRETICRERDSRILTHYVIRIHVHNHTESVVRNIELNNEKQFKSSHFSSKVLDSSQQTEKHNKSRKVPFRL